MRTALLLSSALLMLTACEKEESSHGKAPSNIGPISLNRTRIGTGQPVIATCPLPTGGENIASVKYLWKSTSDGLAMNGQQDETQAPSRLRHLPRRANTRLLSQLCIFLPM